MPTKDRRENEFYAVCGQCNARCCMEARPPLTPKRMKIIEAYLKKRHIPIKTPFVHTAYSYPREREEKNFCIFNDGTTHKCLIHAVKPETCVAGPVTFDINPKTRKVEWFIKKESVCPLAGRLFDDKERLVKHLALAKNEVLRLVKELDAEALRAILRIDEPETFKIDEGNVGAAVLKKLT